MARGTSWPREDPAAPSPPACESIRWCVRGSCRGVAGQGYVAQPLRGAGKVLCSRAVRARAETGAPGKPRAPHRRGVSAAVGGDKRESERDPGFAATPPILPVRPRPPLKAAGRTPSAAAREPGLGSSLHPAERRPRRRRRAGEGSAGPAAFRSLPPPGESARNCEGPRAAPTAGSAPPPPVCLCCNVQPLSSKTHPRGGTDSEAPAERPKSFPRGLTPW